MNQPFNRRQFLTRCGSLALGSASLSAGLTQFNLVHAQTAAANDYKALVCIFLFGGNDSFNMLIPRSNGDYETYASTRLDLAVPKEQLLPLNPLTHSNGVDYGFNPVMTAAKTLFDNQKLAVMGNVGALVEPVSQISYQAKSIALPPQLFSHNDQQTFMQSLQSSSQRNGWAGRAADVLADVNQNQKLSMNISLSGDNIWQGGNSVVPYSINAAGIETLDYLEANNGDTRELRRYQIYQTLLAQQPAHLFQREFARTQIRAWELAGEVNAALQAQNPLTTQFNTQSHLANNLKMVANLIAARSQLSVSRQIFFIGMGDFDTHGNQLGRHPGLLQELSDGMKAFYDATEELGVANNVTTFTASDFGRTLTSNGDGTDHGWGAHQLVMGGAVKGGDIYGKMPELVIGSNDDIGEGRIIPTTSMDQYAATLATWYGLPNSAFADVFPNLTNFEQQNMGFI
ncbi:DUF1501 domain-containing protein [Alteromonadaceae bacterium BrNp21-10]|nr:DUF1501 domain-containing protein [Alteromonadaceae bacterium BrNp21-10]